MVQAERRSRVVISLLLLLSLVGMAVGVFVAPYLVPQYSSPLSASTLAGFNNVVAYLFYVGFLVPAGLALARLLRQTPIEAAAVIVNDVRLNPTFAVWAVLCGHVVLFSALFLVKGYFVFGDGLYFQHILARMASGAVLYRDVNFLYGPAMVYPAFWLSRVVGVTLAYGVYYVAVYLAGLYLLWFCIQAVVGRRQDADRLFILLSVGLFNLLLGMNYAFPRHLLPMAALLLVWRYVEQPEASRLLAPIAATFLALTYSLEMGALAIASILALGGLRVLALWRRWSADAGGRMGEFLGLLVVCLAAVSGLFGIFYAIDPSWQAFTASLKPLLSYSAGGGNSPIYPSLPFFSLMAVSVLAVAFTARTLLSQGWRPGVELVLALLVLSLVMQRPAFGKPDALHIAYSGLPLFLLVLLVVPSRAGWAKARSWYLGMLLLGVMLPLQVLNLFMMKPFFERKLAAWRAPEAMASEGPGSKISIQDSLRRAVAHFGEGHLYYLHVLTYYSLPVIVESRLKQVPYIATLEEAFTFEEIGQVIHELRTSRAIVISRREDLRRPVPPAVGGWQSALYQWTASPLQGSRTFAEVVAANGALSEPLREFLASSYDVVFEDGELVGLIPRRSSGQERM